MKENVGKVAQDLLQKPENDHTVLEQMQESLTDYEKNIVLCAERGLEHFNSDFFIVVLTKKEPLFDNIMRNYFFPRKSCPTPTYDQVVYQYLFDADAIKFLWVIPDKETCEIYKDNAGSVVPEEQQLLQYILDFYSGALDKLVATLNKETMKHQFLEDKHVQPIPN